MITGFQSAVVILIEEQDYLPRPETQKHQKPNDYAIEI